MCEFKDKDGLPIQAGDIIERWSKREWRKYKVESVRSLQTVQGIYDTSNGYKRVGEQVVTEISLKAFGEDSSRSNGWAYKPSKLSKSSDIRKVV